MLGEARRRVTKYRDKGERGREKRAGRENRGWGQEKRTECGEGRAGKRVSERRECDRGRLGKEKEGEGQG